MVSRLLKLLIIFLLLIAYLFVAACQSISSNATPIALVRPTSAAIGKTVTPPDETPEAPGTDETWPVSTDRRLMAARTHDGAWWMWDAETLRPIYLLNDMPRRSPPMHHPIFSFDGRYLAAISVGHVLLWELETRKRRMLLTQATLERRSMTLLTFSPDSHWLAANGCEYQNSHSVCGGGFVSVWNTDDGTLAYTFATGFRVDSLHYSSDGASLTASGCSRTDGVLGYYCYEKATATYDLASGERMMLTRVPQFR